MTGKNVRREPILKWHPREDLPWWVSAYLVKQLRERRRT